MYMSMSMSMVETYDGDEEENVGFQFHPLEEELIVKYVQPRVAKIPNPDVGLEDKDDIYTIEPWWLHHTEIYHFFEPNEWFYFVNRTRKQSKRKVRGGYWKSTRRLLDVKLEDTGRVIGYKRKLSFYVNGDTKATGWTMTEYYLIGESSQNQVLCHFKAPKSSDL